MLYAVCHPQPGQLMLDLVRAKGAPPEPPVPGAVRADPGFESRFRVLYHGLMHSGNRLRRSTGVPKPHHPRDWLLEAQRVQGPENSGRVSERDEDRNSC